MLNNWVQLIGNYQTRESDENNAIGEVEKQAVIEY